MLQIGEIKRAREIGKKGGDNYIWQACSDCGKERWVVLNRNKPASKRCNACARATPEFKAMVSSLMKGRIGEQNGHWKGGRYKNNLDYILVRLYPDDFFYPMANKQGYVLEHRLVMARHLGRCLQIWELVHHKGIRYTGIENRSDNLIDNLQLVSDDRHTQITLLENRITYLEKRVTLLEAENLLFKERGQIIHLVKNEVERR